MASRHLIVVRTRALAANKCHSYYVNNYLLIDKIVH
jgi:hypothetical protein